MYYFPGHLQTISIDEYLPLSLQNLVIVCYFIQFLCRCIIFLYIYRQSSWTNISSLSKAIVCYLIQFRVGCHIFLIILRHKAQHAPPPQCAQIEVFWKQFDISFVFQGITMKFGGQTQFYVWTKVIYFNSRNILYCARARAFSLAENCYIQGNLHDDVNSSDILMNFILNVEFNSINWNFKFILRLVRAFVHAHARIDKKNTPFQENPSYLACLK